jgi:hypothetical protein
MTLKNLLELSLVAVAPDKALTAKLLAAAERNIADAKLLDLSTENHFDAAYKVIVLDALRKQRNLSDYSGDLVPDAAAAECLASASELLTHVRAWLSAHRPDLL